MMAHIEMKAMEKFPIEKLSYDQKLELFEQMNPRDVVELVNVNKGFRSIVVREPWWTFGKHVDEISIRDGNQLKSINIWKFQPLRSRGGIKLSGSSLKFKSFLTLFSKIRSSEKLELIFSSEDQGQEEAQPPFELLTNLESVSRLRISIGDAGVNIEKYLAVLTLNHINRATFEFLYEEKDEQMLGVFSNFVETNLNHCKSIAMLDPGRHYYYWHEALSKIWTEMILITIEPRHWTLDFEGLVHRIVTKDIPSTNPEAAILLWDFFKSKSANNSITGLLSRTPEIRQIAPRDRGEVGGILEQLIVAELIPAGWDESDECVDRFEKFLREGVYFTRSIDSNRKCIYVANPDEYHFFAKYVTIG